MPSSEGATALLAMPTLHGGWLWRWDDGQARWLRLWCVLQGRALLCYTETFAGVDDVGVVAATPEAPSSASTGAACMGAGDGDASGADGLQLAVPRGVDLERPLLALWPVAGSLSRS